MRFDCGRTYSQSCGNLSIIQALDHQGQDFALAFRQVKTGRQRLIGIIDECLCGLCGKRGTAGMRRANSSNQIVSRDILKQVADGACFKCTYEL